MKVTYRISENDYVNVMRLCAKTSPGQIVFLSIFGLLLVGITIFAPLDAGFGDIVAIAGGLLIGLAIATMIQWHIVLPLRSRRHYRKYKAIQEDISIQLLESGIHLVSKNGESMLEWGSILKWRQNEYYILIYQAPGVVHALPKSIASDGFDLPLLISRLNQHVGNPA